MSEHGLWTTRIPYRNTSPTEESKEEGPTFSYSFPTGDFDEETRKHAALVVLEDHFRKEVEPNKWNIEPVDCLVESSCDLNTPAGLLSRHANDTYAILARLHENFAAIYHEYESIVLCESGEWGHKSYYKSCGSLNIYWTTKTSVDAGKQLTVQSRDGRMWEGSAEATHQIGYINHADGDGCYDIQIDGYGFYNPCFSPEEWKAAEEAHDASGQRYWRLE